MQPALKYQILDPKVIENPYPFYQALLDEAPVYQVPGTAVYLVSSWELIHQVLKNQADYSANLTGILITGADGQPELFDLSQFGGAVDAIANADEPSHTVHRKLLLPQLNTRSVSSMREEVRGWAREGVQALVAAGRGDCVVDLANAIPVKVMARLAGLPVEDVDQLLSWAFSGGDILAGTPDIDRMIELGIATGQMGAYLTRHFEAAMARHDSSENANVLDELAAGESTSSLVGSAIRLLAQDEALQARLRQSPDLLERYIEEVVRLESPFKGHYRAVVNETRLGGVVIPEKARVFLLWAAANRDPAVFAHPQSLDIDRGDISDHLGFGHGIHFCIGARVARMEAREILEELLAQTRSFSLDSDFAIGHVPSIFVRRLASLHLQLTPVNR